MTKWKVQKPRECRRGAPNIDWEIQKAPWRRWVLADWKWLLGKDQGREAWLGYARMREREREEYTHIAHSRSRKKLRFRIDKL